MNASHTSRLVCATVAIGIATTLLSAVVSLANYPTESGAATTLMALARASSPASPSVVLAMSAQEE